MSEQKRALITGITGQDGTYLAELLVNKGYHVVGVLDPLRDSNIWGLNYVGVLPKVTLIRANLHDFIDCQRLLLETEPHEIYHLAAQSSVSASFREPAMTMRVNTQPVINLLEAIRTLSSKIRFYHASSSEMYGRVDTCPISTKTLFNPVSPYAVSKVAAHQTVRSYRDSYSLYAVSGILFNHESALRKSGFFTRKLIESAIELASGKRDSVSFGNLDVRRDFGYAPDYVKAMWLMLQQDEPEDFLICTGESVSLREIVEHIFTRAGASLDSIHIDQSLYRPNEIADIYGDPSRASDVLNWRSQYNAFETMNLIVDETLQMFRDGNTSPL